MFGSGGPTNGPAAVESWASEKQYYDYASNGCSAPPNQSCGHYTQVVWANSTKLGCGYNHCASITYGYTIVCNYAPGGNSGGKPY